MIVKNEASTLPRALDGAKSAVNEIVIVDTGSTDGTQDIARRYTDKVYSFAWTDDFAAARNFAREKCRADYFMWLDADDIVPSKTAAAVKRLMKSTALADVIMLPYVAATDSRGKPTYSYYRERMIKNDGSYVWNGRVHEAIAYRNSVFRLNAPIIHAKPTERASGTRNLDIYRSMIASGAALSQRELYYYARELYYNEFFTDAERELIAFLREEHGFSANKTDASILLSHCYEKRGELDSAMQAALNALAYGPPCGEACCRVGSLYLSLHDYRAAACWFEYALRLKPDLSSGAFVQADYYGFIPLVNLTVCYDRLGNAKKAFSYHRRAKAARPDHSVVLANSAYFASLGFS